MAVAVISRHSVAGEGPDLVGPQAYAILGAMKLQFRKK